MDSWQEDEDEEIEYGEDDDELLRQDVEAVKRACMLTGSDAAVVTDSGDESEEIDDMEFVRSIQKKFCLPMDVGAQSPGGLSDLDEDDFETLRSIERRFSKYDSDETKKKSASCLQESNFVSNTGNSLEDVPFEAVKGSEESLELPLHSKSSLSMSLSSISLDGVKQAHHSTSTNGSRFRTHESSSLSVVPLRKSVFSDSARVFIEALKKNRLCQKLIRIKLLQVEAMIGENKELTKRMKCLADFQRSCKRQATRLFGQEIDARVRLISIPNASKSSKKTKDDKMSPLLFGPRENSHVPIFRRVLSKFPSILKKKLWSTCERENLAKGIKQQVQEFLFRNSMEKFCGQEESVAQPYCLDTVIAEINSLEITPQHVRSFLPQIDWKRLSSMYVKDRSGEECRARWISSEDPLINWNPWTKSEDKHLLFIVQQSGPYNWVQIADMLGRHRTASQCLSRYQRSLNANILKGSWTEEEDAQLRAAVQVYGEKKWQLVASHLQGRSGVQCSNRWRKILHPSRRKVGRWTVEEDKRLKVAVMVFGRGNWKKISRLIPCRTQVQCRDRWLNSLDPSLKLEEWTEEEDLKLTTAIGKHGHKWSKVAASVPSRTGGQCRRRWKVLFPHELLQSQKAQKIKKLALISNFVYRSKERPAIGPEDFVTDQDDTLMNDHENANGGKPERRKRRSKLKRKPNEVSTSDDPQPACCKRSRKKCAEGTNENSVAADGGETSSVSKLQKKVKRRKVDSTSNVIIACEGINSEFSEVVGGDETLLAFNQSKKVKRKGKPTRKGIGPPQDSNASPSGKGSDPRVIRPDKDAATTDTMSNLVDVPNGESSGGGALIASTSCIKPRKRKVKLTEKEAVSPQGAIWQSASDPNKDGVIQPGEAVAEMDTMNNLQDVPHANCKAPKVQRPANARAFRKLKENIRRQGNGRVGGSGIGETADSDFNEKVQSIQQTCDKDCESGESNGLAGKVVPEQQCEPWSCDENSATNSVWNSETISLFPSGNPDDEAIVFTNHDSSDTVNFIERGKTRSLPAEENVDSVRDTLKCSTCLPSSPYVGANVSGEASDVRMLDKGSGLDLRSTYSALHPSFSDQTVNGYAEPTSIKDVYVQVSTNMPSEPRPVSGLPSNGTEHLGREMIESFSSEGVQSAGKQKPPETIVALFQDPICVAHKKVDDGNSRRTRRASRKDFNYRDMLRGDLDFIGHR